jgi:hypothetical protein
MKRGVSVHVGGRPRSMPHNEAWRISTQAYSPECVEDGFSELRPYGVLTAPFIVTAPEHRSRS